MAAAASQVQAKLYQFNYSKEGYTQLGKSKSKDAMVHYLIALGQPIATIEKFAATRLKVEDPENHRLTPLALALILGKNDVARSLIKLGASLNDRDSQGLTALHHVVLANATATLPPEFREQLDKVKDTYNGTPKDLERLWGPLPEEVPFLYRDASGKKEKLTPARFRELTGITYVDWYRTTPKDYLRMRTTLKQAPSGDLIPNDPSLAAFERKPPSLVLTPEPFMGLGVEADEDIQSGAIAGKFVGRLTDAKVKTQKEQLYRVSCVDPTEVGSEGALINEGPPNATLLSLTNGYRGLPSVTVVETLRKIKRGEKLRINYSPGHGVKKGVYRISPEGYADLVHFWQTNKLEQIFTGMRQKRAQGKEVFTPLQDQMINYTFTTTNAYIKLFLRKDLSISTVRSLLSDPEAGLFFNMLLKTSPRGSDFAESLEVIEKIHQLAKTDKQLIDLIDELPNTISSISYLDLLLFMKDEPFLSSKKIEKYRLTGELFDKLAIFYRGTLQGSLQTFPEWDEKEAELDEKVYISAFHQLSPHLQGTFLGRVTGHSIVAGREGRPIKQAAFDRLIKKLNKITEG